MSANGRLLAAELTAVQGSIRLANTTATAWRGLVAAVYAETGAVISITSPYGGYRDIAAQKAMWADSSTSTTGVVAYPGTSVHGWGRCVDITNRGAVGYIAGTGTGLYSRRLDTIALRFGFRRPIANEGWHYQHDGTTVPAGGGASGIEEEDMARFQFVKATGDPTVWLSVDCLWRRPMADGRDYTDTALLLGIPAAYTEVSWLTSFGVPVSIDVTALAAQIAERIPTPAGVDPAAVQEAARLGAAAALADLRFPTTLTIDTPPATGTLS